MTSFSVERDDGSAPYFDAAAAGQLLVRRCRECGQWFAPQTRLCPNGHELLWEVASGDAILVTWAVDHQPPLAPELAAQDTATSVFGLVELTEGPWLQVPLVGVNPEDLREGLALHVGFVRPGGGEALAAFTPA